MAQQAVLSGTIRDESNQPVTGANVSLKGTNFQMVTDSLGGFRFEKVPFGDYQLEIKRVDFAPVSQPVKVDAPESFFGTILTGVNNDVTVNNADNIPTVSLNDEEVKESSSTSVASVLSAARDPFVSAATFNFSAARFRIRGYDDENFMTLMNGVPMQDLATGRTMYNTWSGLNDVMRSRENSIGLSAAPFTFGGVGGAYHIDSRASKQRRQLSVGYAASNRAYENRFMVTYGSGIMNKGWAYSLSYSRRWAEEGFVPGTFYDGHAYYAAVEKMIGDKHSISLTGFGSSVINGRGGSAIREMYDLAGTNYYNPNWGYQNGEKRNAVVGNNHQPVIILSHEWKIDDKANVQTSIGYTFGKTRLSGLDWFNAADPRPDYYRRLPSFDPNYGEDPTAYAEYKAQIDALLRNNEEERQIKWDQLYAANAMADTNFNGTTGKWSKYIIGDRVTDNKRLFANMIYNRVMSDHVTLDAGLQYLTQTSEYYREVNDLLGGDFYVDLNQFAELSNPNDSAAAQNDLDNPNRILKEGDKYQYDYVAHINRAGAWFQSTFKYDRMDYFLALNLSSTSFFREGKVRSGIFSDNSHGDSEKQNFFNYGFKGGATYKYNGRNYFFANAAYMTRAPYFDNVFISPRTRNEIVKDLTDEKIFSTEAGYLLKAPRIKGKAVAYYTQFMDATDSKIFYHEDFRNFVTYTLTNIDRRHVGVEIAVEAALGKGFSANAVAAVGQHVYSDRPIGTAALDNADSLLVENETLYMKNLRVSNGAQSAYSFGLTYRSRRFWFVNANLNYFDNLYIDANPVRRTLAALDLVNEGDALWKQILQQEKTDGQFTLDLSGGWSWRLNNKFKDLKRQTFLVLNLGVSNVLNNQDLVTGGFEQLRYDFADKNVNKFPTRYTYAFGTTFFANIVLRIN